MEKIRIANNSYTAIYQYVQNLKKNPANFERVFKKEGGFLVSVALGAKLRREEHTKLYVRFLERTLSDAPENYKASAQMVGGAYRINIYFQAPTEVISNPQSYNAWFVEHLEGVLNSSRMRSLYVHEFVHTLDFRRIDSDYLYNRPTNQTVVGTPEYANAPLELNAYFLQAISHVKNKLKKAKTQQDKINLIGSTPQEFVDKFMSTYLNHQLRTHLSPENRQRLMKRAATAWEFLKKT